MPEPPTHDSDARRHEFTRRAPEMRAELVAELASLLDRAAGLSPDEAAVVRHLLAHAGFSLSGNLFVPALAVLWGEEESYVPVVRLPAERVRAAAATLRRRGILSGTGTHEGGVVVVASALRELAAGRAPTAAAAPKGVPAAKRSVILTVAVSIDGFAAEFPDAPAANAVFRRGDPAKQLAKLQKEPGGDLVCAGDAEIVHALLKKDLVDVLIVTVLPVLLGGGAPAFKKGRPERKLKLASCLAFPDGSAQLRYGRD
jgi:hypothetical protein